MRNKAMTKMLMATAVTSAMLASASGNEYSYYDYLDELLPAKGGTKKEYKNKNANVEYYTDEKGNIRRRKVSK